MPTAVNLTWRQVRRWRIRRQLLLEPAPDAVAVARRLGGVHAQVASCGALIAGIRCAGPAVDGAVTSVSPAGWLGRPLAPPPAEEAERAVLLRFLESNGPATAVDVSRWWGEQPAPARRTIRAAGDAVAPVSVDGESGYVVRACDVDELAAVPDGGADPADDPLLLPGFDPWVLAPLSHRTRAIPDGRAAEVSRTAGWISPVLVVDSRVAGVWEHRGAAITVRPFAPLPARTRAGVERAAARYGPLLGAVAVTWT